MNSLALDLNSKSSSARDNTSPLPPPSLNHHSVSEASPPSLPIMSFQTMSEGSPAQVLAVPSLGSLDIGLSGSLTPTTPTTPTTPSSPSMKPKKSNPLNDLIDTERAYVDNLTGIIRKVAAAWSRSNLPPPDLDTMFRSIEGVYKANRTLHSKLKEIGSNPSSPKALGDLLMRWIDDLEGPYTTYCSKYCCGFDTWHPVQSNQRLAPILTSFSAANPPADSQIWTLDTLFLLPKARLKYYRKLYSRLLKSTAPGRSDHRLLVGALDTLDRLLDTLESRSSIKVGGDAQAESGRLDTEDEVVIDMRTQSLSPPAPTAIPLRSQDVDANQGSESSSARGSSHSGGERLSRETASTSISRGSNATLSLPITNLERRLSTQRTLDIFTMKPKVVKLQMSPPSLTFTREMRASVDVVIRFTPRVTNEEVVHRQGHIFVLSDLFLICERMSPEDQAQHGMDGADMWLCYPPLAGKVLRVSEVSDQGTALQIAIMRKENLVLETDSTERRDRLIAQFKECIEFSGSLPPPSKVPPPPVPALNGLQRLQTPSGGSTDGSRSPPYQRAASPSTNTPQNVINGSPFQSQSPPEYQNLEGSPLANPSLNFGNNYPEPPRPLRPSASAQPFTNSGPSIGPGFVIPPARSTSFVGRNGGPPPSGPNPHVMGHMHPQAPGHLGPPNQPNFLGSNNFPHPGHLQQPPFPVNPINGRRPNPYIVGGIPSGPSGYPPGPNGLPPRPPSEPPLNSVRKTPSTRSLASQYSQPEHGGHAPPLPMFPGGGYPGSMPRNQSQPTLHAPQPRPMLPSAQMGSRSVSMVEPSFHEPSPPNSPVPEMPQHTGPITSVISAQMKCKVFLQQQHAQWKSLGSAKLKLYRQDPINVKQLVVEADNKDKSVLISTIVLTDGVERVGKTGVAIELSDQGTRTGIVYMIQLRNEASAGGLFDSLLAGSDRSTKG